MTNKQQMWPCVSVGGRERDSIWHFMKLHCQIFERSTLNKYSRLYENWFALPKSYALLHDQCESNRLEEKSQHSQENTSVERFAAFSSKLVDKRTRSINCSANCDHNC